MEELFVADDKQWYRYLAEEKARMDEEARLEYAEEKGFEKGTTKKAIEMAAKLFKLGTAFDVIKEASGLSDKELLDIQNGQLKSV